MSKTITTICKDCSGKGTRVGDKALAGWLYTKVFCDTCDGVGTIDTVVPSGEADADFLGGDTDEPTELTDIFR